MIGVRNTKTGAFSLCSAKRNKKKRASLALPSPLIYFFECVPNLPKHLSLSLSSFTLSHGREDWGGEYPLGRSSSGRGPCAGRKKEEGTREGERRRRSRLAPGASFFSFSARARASLGALLVLLASCVLWPAAGRRQKGGKGGRKAGERRRTTNKAAAAGAPSSSLFPCPSTPPPPRAQQPLPGGGERRWGVLVPLFSPRNRCRGRGARGGSEGGDTKEDKGGPPPKRALFAAVAPKKLPSRPPTPLQSLSHARRRRPGFFSCLAVARAVLLAEQDELHLVVAGEHCVGCLDVWFWDGGKGRREGVSQKNVVCSPSPSPPPLQKKRTHHPRRRRRAGCWPRRP